MRLRNAVLTSMLIVAFGAGYAGLSLVDAQNDERLPEGAPTPRPEAEGWIDLLDADHAGQWQNVTSKQERFEIEDGVFHVAGKKPTNYIAYRGESFGDFQLHVEFKVTKEANSGVFIRTDPQNPVQGGMEIQVIDDYRQPPNKSGSGGLYDVACPLFNLARPTGQWNSYDITCKGSNLDVVMNGWRVLTLDLSVLTMPIGKFDTPLAELPQQGHVVLQDHGDEVWFRNVLVKPL